MKIHREETVSFSSVITLLNLPTFPQGRNRAVQQVKMPSDVGLYLIDQGAKEMANSYPILHPDDFVLYPDFENDNEDIFFRVSRNSLLLDLEESGVICFEPAWNPSMRVATMARNFRVRVQEEVTEAQVTTNQNLYGDLRVFPGGSSDPLFVVPCPKEGNIIFSNTSHEYKYVSSEELFIGIINSPKFIGAYDEISEEILMARMLALHEQMSPWVDIREEAFDPNPHIQIATKRLTNREKTTRKTMVTTDGINTTTVVEETTETETTIEETDILM